MTTNQTTTKSLHVLYLCDRSGSVETAMGPYAGKTEAKQFIEAQKQAAADMGITIYMTMYTFDDILVECFSNQDVASIQFPESAWDNWCTPRGATALIDSILTAGKAWERVVSTQKLRLPANAEHDEMFVVWTDGQDNTSQHTLLDQNTYIKSLRARNVTCLWTASCQDAVVTGTQGGFAAGHCLNVATAAQRSAAAAAGVPAPPAFARAVTGAARGVSSGFQPNFAAANAQYRATTSVPRRPGAARRAQTTASAGGAARGRTAPMSPWRPLPVTNAAAATGVVAPPSSRGLVVPPPFQFTAPPSSPVRAGAVPPPPGGGGRGSAAPSTPPPSALPSPPAAWQIVPPSSTSGAPAQQTF